MNLTLEEKNQENTNVSKEIVQEAKNDLAKEATAYKVYLQINLNIDKEYAARSAYQILFRLIQKVNPDSRLMSITAQDTWPTLLSPKDIPHLQFSWKIYFGLSFRFDRIWAHTCII